jgi:hypothetical protein
MMPLDCIALALQCAPQDSPVTRSRRSFGQSARSLPQPGGVRCDALLLQLVWSGQVRYHADLISSDLQCLQYR